MSKEEIKTCCEKCYSTYTEHDWPAHTVYDACINPDCPCHQTKQDRASLFEHPKAIKELEKAGWEITQPIQPEGWGYKLYNLVQEEIKCSKNGEPKGCNQKWREIVSLVSQTISEAEERILKEIRDLFGEDYDHPTYDWIVIELEKRIKSLPQND